MIIKTFTKKSFKFNETIKYLSYVKLNLALGGNTIKSIIVNPIYFFHYIVKNFVIQIKLI
jgi:hypothetical protein